MMFKNRVRVNDTHLNVYSEGNGTPTIVFMAGSGVTAPVLEYKPLYRRCLTAIKLQLWKKRAMVSVIQ